MRNLILVKVPAEIEVTGPHPCPFCKGVFSTNTPKDPMKSNPVILHSLPTCKEYDAIDTLEDAIQYMRCTRN